MPDLVNVEYKQTGQSTKTNQFGMREMQEKAFEARNAKYLLIKAPPASGKSRALMFVALDKLKNQGLIDCEGYLTEKELVEQLWEYLSKM